MMGWGWGYGPGNGFFGGYWWMGIIMLAVQALFWGLVIYFGIRLFQGGASRITNGNGGSHVRIDPVDILKERYARGEIDAEEYRRRKEDLQS
ncbi:SHOCT domain protein [Acididesulfobacillus acetoxydans]|uniref:SHOCT domain protein n=1 Tax=Acididesulfobacillus acetoxydans TaxID=1561005 RepID=A0A8S0Y357_9FIRM|nr:SHOCT domain-containing protein [Acididesulfobacillus acetoxydans]CAA7601645.1 SHOCT domain protein [Acididesulfobacillus acetoxydans]CEJ07132.1 Short C-terminal domain [Acididesulfobacillus acetoxydans]